MKERTELREYWARKAAEKRRKHAVILAHEKAASNKLEMSDQEKAAWVEKWKPGPKENPFLDDYDPWWKPAGPVLKPMRTE